MEELKSILESSPTASPVHPDARAHNTGMKLLKIIIILLVFSIRSEFVPSTLHGTCAQN